MCRKHGISSATFYKWKAKYGGLDVSEARRLRSLEDGNRRLKKLLAETSVPLVPGRGPNQRLSIDFVHDALSDGRRFRILAAVDDYTRENLCLVAGTLLPGGRVIRELEALIARRGLPRQCFSDNGPEFNGLAMLGWSQGWGSTGTTSSLVSRSRMPSLKASMVACATSS